MLHPTTEKNASAALNTSYNVIIIKNKTKKQQQQQQKPSISPQQSNRDYVEQEQKLRDRNVNFGGRAKNLATCEVIRPSQLAINLIRLLIILS